VKSVKSTFVYGVYSFLLLMQAQVQAEPVVFSSTDLNGVEWNLSDHRGKWVLVNVWATWCMPCLKELPELEAFHNKHKDKDAVVLGISMESIELDELRRFIKDKSVTYPIVQMEFTSKTPFGSVFGMPTSFLINPKGEVAGRETGVLTAEMIEDFIKTSTFSN